MRPSDIPFEDEKDWNRLDPGSLPTGIQAVYVGRELVALVCADTAGGDYLVELRSELRVEPTPRSPPLLLVVRQHGDGIYSIVGHAIRRPNYSLCSGASGCKCSVAHADHGLVFEACFHPVDLLVAAVQHVGVVDALSFGTQAVQDELNDKMLSHQHVQFCQSERTFDRREEAE